ncbi:hypothetical protein GCG54_00006552 [Colletotrichum gloeosporioides]|uniref:Uncharacterized protein n=1 Tax=Colletotrichum gloeosporioides TaxID=474922 RepID=A0A8H4FPS2_COLGL|nr:uncharacterized protein GCG54_00006552 [Colletotrichum gloeosporioides]KAF3808684.1 hypothetical protein GCG54_00006552 [Colletotrichum gloeosporioides]
MAYFEAEKVHWPPEPAVWPGSDLNVDSVRLLGRKGTAIEFLPRSTRSPFIGVCFTCQGYIYPHGYSRTLFGDEHTGADVKWWLHAKADTFVQFFNRITEDVSSLELVPLEITQQEVAAITAKTHTSVTSAAGNSGNQPLRNISIVNFQMDCRF